MGFKRKFETGDKVRVIKSNDSRYKKIGEIFFYNSSYGSKGWYKVKFDDGYCSYYSYELEKVEESNNTNINSNKLKISDLKPGMKVRIRPDLKEGQSTVVYVNKDMENYAGTIATIKGMLNNISDKYNSIYLENIPYSWDIDCFSEIVEEPKKEVKTSEEIELPLKEGQIVTLLDGKKYEVVKNNTDKITCSFCSLSTAKCGECRCNITHIKGKTSCTFVIPAHHYFKLYKDQKTENNSSESINPIEKDSSIKETGIITKVNFTLTDFKLEELEHSKFTIL